MALTEVPIELSSTPGIVDNSTGTAITIDASSNVDVTGTVTADGLTVGDSSSSFTLATIQSSTSGESELRMGDTDTDAGSISYTNSDDTMTFRAAAAARMSLNSTGLDVTGTVTADGLTVDGNPIINGTSPQLFFQTGASNYNWQLAAQENVSDAFEISSGAADASAPDDTYTKRLVIQNTGDISFYEDTGTTAKLFWDASAESLGIGTSSPTGLLTLGTGTFSAAAANTSALYTSTTAGLVAVADGLLLVDRAGADVFKVDTSGNVGIGTSSPNYVLNTNYNANATFSNAASDFTQMWQNSDVNGLGVALADDLTARLVTNNGYELAFNNGTTEAMRIDASGNLLVGTTSSASSTAGIKLTAAGTATFVRDGVQPVYINRLTSDGDLAVFAKDGTTVGSIGTLLDGLYIGSPAGTDAYIGFTNSIVYPSTSAGVGRDDAIDLGTSDHRFKDLYLSGDVNVTGGKISSYASDSSAPYFADAGNVGIRFSQASVDDIVPCDSTGADRDNGINWGAAGARWATIFAATGAINTSDANEKQDIAELDEAEHRVAVACKGLLRKFRWKDAVEAKGDEARIHFGIIAQDLQAAFEAEGLDAARYAMFCSDTWVDKETGDEITRLGVRHDQLLAFIIAAI